jgi:wobble nucleotide-excising tRNase
MGGMGILADRDGKPPHVPFRRYNLIYGFNGSGKSTLSRMFASFQSGARHPRLPASCTFDIEMSDGTDLSCPDKLAGLEQRVLVFNTDFVEQNLQWSNARANPVFYIGKAQAKLADELAACRERLPASNPRQAAAAAAIRSAERVLQTFRRDRARLIADRLRLRGRQYEAPQLTSDYAQFALDDKSQLDEEALETFSVTCRLESPSAKISAVTLELDNTVSVLSAARFVCGIAPSTAALSDLQAHPQMLVWVTDGHQYHAAHNLKECLFYQNPLSPERMQTIQSAIDGGIDRILSSIDTQRDNIAALESALSRVSVPSVLAFGAAHANSYERALATFSAALDVIRRAVAVATGLLEEKRRAPGVMLDPSGVPNEWDAKRMIATLCDAQTELNAVIENHNKNADDFVRLQDEARAVIRKHYLSEGAAEYEELQEVEASANAEARAAEVAEKELRDRIQCLENQIREHGPAADAINRLLQSYLGHSELSIVAVNNGYEMHRHGRLITGLPSEGEKTAIALCYFLSMLESEGRKTSNLIVVVDDPVSSLDSRSLNFACNLVKSRLNEAAQLFVLTHNLNCVNEFRKPWKSKARPSDGREPTATMLFLDVSVPTGKKSRTTKIIDLPALLREYDSEYHYLFHHVLKFADAGGEYDYAYMMPNVLRRVLEVFLAFRCPGSAGLTPKIEQLCKAHPELDKDRLNALERLTQVESHSDSLDDLISFSSMTFEETKDATGALLAVMEQVDQAHIGGLRRICN